MKIMPMTFMKNNCMILETKAQQNVSEEDMDENMMALIVRKILKKPQPLDKANLNWVKETFVNDGVLKHMNLNCIRSPREGARG
jgi:hypothetical protein